MPSLLARWISLPFVWACEFEAVFINFTNRIEVVIAKVNNTHRWNEILTMIKLETVDFRTAHTFVNSKILFTLEKGLLSRFSWWLVIFQREIHFLSKAHCVHEWRSSELIFQSFSGWCMLSAKSKQRRSKHLNEKGLETFEVSACDGFFWKIISATQRAVSRWCRAKDICIFQDFANGMRKKRSSWSLICTRFSQCSSSSLSRMIKMKNVDVLFDFSRDNCCSLSCRLPELPYSNDYSIYR